MAAARYRQAEAALLEGNYSKARKLFERALKENPDFAAAKRGLGICYEAVGNYSEAARYYRETLSLDSLFSRPLYYETGRALYKSGQYADALQFYRRFVELQTEKDNRFELTEHMGNFERDYVKKVKDDIRACHISLDSIKWQTIEEIANLGSRINTPADEYFPFIANDQQTLYYTRRKGYTSDEDLYQSRRKWGEWERGKPAQGNFNTRENEGMTTLVRDGRRLFFTACGRKATRGPCDLWQAEIEGDKISVIGSLAGEVNSPKWESQASVSCDGGTLFFASNRVGGYGGTDIWVSQLEENGRWSTPLNLGPKINTEWDEEAPFIANDGQSIYFASNGHPGLGEQDIFVSWKEAGKNWSTPVNLGPALNTPYRELGFSLAADGKSGYLSSNRPGGFGGMDIYSFRLSEELYGQPITLVEGFVRDYQDGTSLPSPLRLGTDKTIQTDSSGRFFLCVPADSTLELSLQREGYLPYQKSFYVPPWENKEFFTILILLQSGQDPKPENRPVSVTRKSATVETALQSHSQRLYFDFDSYQLNELHRQKLNDFFRSFDRDSVERIEIMGFADDIGTDTYNLKLSEERAKSIALFLVEQGFELPKIYMEGRGEIKSGDSREKNRRVEILVFVRQ